MSATLLPPPTTIGSSSTAIPTSTGVLTLPGDGTTEAPKSLSATFPFWAYILIGAGVLGIIILIVFAAKRQKSSRTKQKKIAEYRTKEDKRFAKVAAELGELYTATDHAKIERESQYYTKKGAKQIKRTG